MIILGATVEGQGVVIALVCAELSPSKAEALMMTGSAFSFESLRNILRAGSIPIKQSSKFTFDSRILIILAEKEESNRLFLNFNFSIFNIQITILNREDPVVKRICLWRHGLIHFFFSSFKNRKAKGN